MKISLLQVFLLAIVGVVLGIVSGFYYEKTTNKIINKATAIGISIGIFSVSFVVLMLVGHLSDPDILKAEFEASRLVYLPLLIILFIGSILACVIPLTYIEEKWYRYGIKKALEKEESYLTPAKIEKDRKADQERKEADQERNEWGNLWEWKQETEQKLQTQADGYLHLLDNMPSSHVRLFRADYPLGYANSKEIFLNTKIFDDKDPEWLMQYVIKHELVHNWIFWKGIKMDDSHGKEFNDKLDSIL